MKVKGKVNSERKAIGRRIRQVRGFDLSQGAFAERLGISQSQLSKYERGLISPPAEVLLRIREKFNVSVDWLLTGADEERREPSI
jgi:transcriptional regulator with XRE-family HTH domain